MMKRNIHCIETNFWRNRGLSLLTSICLLIGLAVATSCNETLTPDQFTDPMARELTLRFYLPGVMPSTKALVDPINSVSPESQLYNVKVWIFNHVDPEDAEAVAAADAETAVAYTQVNNINFVNSSNLPSGSGYYTAQYWTDTYTLEVKVVFPGYIVGREADKMRFDFYVLANASSIGLTPDQSLTRGQLKALSFGYKTDTDDLFGPWQKARATWGNSPVVAINGGADGTIGLPISGFFNKDKDGNPTGVDLSFLKDNRADFTSDQVKEKLPIVQLQRGVSKVRFFFAQPTGMTGASVTKIEILANQIPAQTYVFPRETGSFALPTDVTYVNKVAEIPGPTGAQITELADPESLNSTEFTTTQAREQALDAAVGSKNNTQRFIYLRETDKDLTCKIYYKLSEDGDELSEEFKLSDSPGYDATTSNMHRNHYWTVYAYFLGGKLYVKPTSNTEWVDAETLNYTMKLNTNMRLFDSWLYRYDTVDQDYTNWTNWAGSHMAVSEGREADGRPSRSPQIQLVTTGTDTFDLVVDNSDFEIVRANKNETGVVTGYEASTDGKLNIAAGDDVYTYFYIVPKAGVTPSNPVAKVSLIYNDSVLGPQKVTFNYNSLPGYSDDSSEIWAYFFAASDYNITNKLRMYFQDNNNPLVPTPVQN